MSEEETSKLTQLLAKLEPGFIPFAVFKELTRIWVSPIVEIIPLRKVDDKVQVLLVRREKNDIFWPNQWHTPGTVMRATDEKGNLTSAFKRVLKDELEYRGNEEPKFVYVRFSQSTRGSEFSAVFYIEANGETKNGEWFDVENLPEDIVTSQIEMILKTAECFKRDRLS